MSFVAPLWLALGGVVVAGLVLAHLFSTNVPPRQPLPTVRFVPRGAQMSVLRTKRITDVLLLALRVLAVLLLAMALAGAHVPRGGPSRVLLVDASRAVAGPAQSFTAEDAEGAVAVVFDSSARVVSRATLDTVSVSDVRGSLSAGLVASHRAIANVSTGRDAIELVIVSPVVREEVDSATRTLLALWEGPVRIVRVPTAEPPSEGAAEIRSTGDDPVAAALSTIPSRTGAPTVRIVRGAPVSADSTWASNGRVLVPWPSADSTTSARSAFAVSTPRQTVVGLAKPARAPATGRSIAWWNDGSPAVTESAHGAGCIRDAAIVVDPVGDVALRDSFRELVRTLIEPCGGASDFTAVPDSAILPAARQAAATGYVPAPDTKLPLILAALALAALALEQLFRARKRAVA